MNIIDFHTHLPWKAIFPEKFIAGSIDQFLGEKAGTPALQSMMRTLYNKGFTDELGALFLREMQDAGIARSVLLIADFGFGMGEPELNLRQMYAHHTRLRNDYGFIVYGGMDPRRGEEGVALFAEYAEKGWIDGLKLYPPCGFELDHPGLTPLFEICNHYGLPVLTHTGPSLQIMRTEELYPQTLIRRATEFPNLVFIAAHGLRNMAHTEEALNACENIYIDISGFHLLPGEELSNRLQRMEELAPDRVLFGTDWPMFKIGTTLKNIVQNFIQVPLGETFREKVLFGNAQRLLAQKTTAA